MASSSLASNPSRCTQICYHSQVCNMLLHQSHTYRCAAHLCKHSTCCCIPPPTRNSCKIPRDDLRNSQHDSCRNSTTCVCQLYHPLGVDAILYPSTGNRRGAAALVWFIAQSDPHKMTLTTHSAYPLVSVVHAQQIVEKHAVALPSEEVGLQEALGRVLAQTVLASDDLPPFPASIKVITFYIV